MNDVTDSWLSTVPLLMQPFPSPLSQNFGRTAVNRLQSLVLALHFQTPSNELSTLSLRDALLSNKLDPSLSSLVFRTMLKSISRIVIKYPLVFDACWLQVCMETVFMWSHPDKVLVSMDLSVPSESKFLSARYSQVSAAAEYQVRKRKQITNSSSVPEGQLSGWKALVSLLITGFQCTEGGHFPSGGRKL